LALTQTNQKTNDMSKNYCIMVLSPLKILTNY
jgi:hypothetical protein